MDGAGGPIAVVQPAQIGGDVGLPCGLPRPDGVGEAETDTGRTNEAASTGARQCPLALAHPGLRFSALRMPLRAHRSWLLVHEVK